MMASVVSLDPSQPAVLPTADSFPFFDTCEGKEFWKNEITLKRYDMSQPSCIFNSLTKL